MDSLVLDAYVANAVRPAMPEDAGLEFLASMHMGQWTDVFAKALRLATTALNGTPRTMMLANKPDFMQARVIGDHGTYTSTIRRPSADAASTKIEDWTCTCPWFDYAFDRTRGWKNLEGRVCSHVLACFWKGRATPLDTAGQAPDFKHPPGQKQGPAPDQGNLFGPAGTPGADSAIPQPDEATYDSTRDMPAQFLQQMPQVTDQELPEHVPPSIFPTGPGTAQNPWNPKQRTKGPLDGQTVLDLGTGVDYPGGTPPPTQGYGMGVSIVDPSPPSPMRPIKLPGTLSNYYRTYMPPVFVVTGSFTYGAQNDFEQWFYSMRARKAKPVAALVRACMLEARGGKLPMPGAVPMGITNDGLPRYRTLDMGWDPISERRMNADEMSRMDGTYPGVPGPGAPEQTGTHFEAPANKRAEVIDVDPVHRMAFIHIPLNDSGPLHPHILAGWVDYADLRPIPDAHTPFRVRVGPARPRR